MSCLLAVGMVGRFEYFLINAKSIAQYRKNLKIPKSKSQKLKTKIANRKSKIVNPFTGTGGFLTTTHHFNP